MKNWSLNGKIVAILSVFVGACALISFFNLSSIGKINASLTSITDIYYKRAAFSFEERGIVRMLVIEEKNYIEQNASEREATLQRMDGLQRRFKSIHDEWMTLASDFARPKLEFVQQQLAAWSDNDRKVRALADKGDLKAATSLSLTVGRAARAAIEKPLDDLVEFNKKLMNDSAIQAQDLASRSTSLAILISLLATACGIGLAFLVLRAVNAAIDRVISNLRDNSQEVTSAAQQIAASSEELSQGATEQASSLEETSASIEEMNATVKTNSDNAARAAELSTSSRQSATKGKEVVTLMCNAIHEIHESTQQISDVVKIIAEIEKKTTVINDIVFKTQLLSFNASVEAARAGAHGKGFAVVAEEVGKLAQLSGDASRDISEMLAASVQKVNALIAVAGQKVQVGSDIAQQCGSVLEEIVQNVGRLNEMANDIASASQEQSKGIDEVTSAVGQLDHVTQQNAATSEEAASAAEELSAQAESLNGMVQVLIQTIKGGRAERASSPAVGASRTTPPASLSLGKRPSAKVLHIKNAASKKKVSNLKAAVGAEWVSEDDPRFKEV